MAAYRRVNGFKSPAGCTPGPSPGPTLGNEYGRPLPFYLTDTNTAIIVLRPLYWSTRVSQELEDFVGISCIRLGKRCFSSPQCAVSVSFCTNTKIESNSHMHRCHVNCHCHALW